MKAEELASNYADAVATHRLESLYGTSKSYTLEKAKERDEAGVALSEELRRLAKIEEAARSAIAAFEALGIARDAYAMLTERRKCENTMTALKQALETK